MTMFSRTDKPADPPAKPVTPLSAVPSPAPAPQPTPAPAPVEMRRQPAPSPAAGHQAVSVSVISKALKITGQLESTEDIQIEGEVDGDVRGQAVKVGQNAKVNGTIYAEEVELAGTVTGKIEARKIVLTSSAHMNGDLVHQDLRIDFGAYIDGHCRPEYGKADGKVHAVKTMPAPVAISRAN